MADLFLEFWNIRRLFGSTDQTALYKTVSLNIRVGKMAGGGGGQEIGLIDRFMLFVQIIALF